MRISEKFNEFKRRAIDWCSKNIKPSVDEGIVAWNTKLTKKQRILVIIVLVLLLAYNFILPLFLGEKEVATNTGPKTFVELNEKQIATLQLKPVGLGEFLPEFPAYGNIDFNENSAVQVFTNYQGRVIKANFDVGDVIKKGDILFTVDSPDLANAESALLTAKGVYDNTTAVLNRAKQLYELKSISLQQYQQNISDQTGAEASLKAARDTVRIFGKSASEIAKIETKRKMDSVLAVLSPVDGQVVTRNAQPGLLVQPGNAPAPFVVADTAMKWLIINAPESDSVRLRVGQELDVVVPALPDLIFKAKVKIIGSVVDPATRTVMVRAEVPDPKNVMRSGMYANYVVHADESIRGIAVPVEAVVREGDGSNTVWVTTNNGQRMNKRTVKLGIRNNTMVQIADGLQEGEIIASTNAIFLSNLLVIGE
jgi:cobalt-zinc-cadmium efflux system membrane fusion protein